MMVIYSAYLRTSTGKSPHATDGLCSMLRWRFSQCQHGVFSAAQMKSAIIRRTRPLANRADATQ